MNNFVRRRFVSVSIMFSIIFALCLYVNSLKSFRLLLGDYLLKHNKADWAFACYDKVVRKSRVQNDFDINAPYLRNFRDTLIQKLKTICGHLSHDNIGKNNIVEIDRLLSRIELIKGALEFNSQQGNFLAEVYSEVGKYYKDRNQLDFSQKAYREAMSYRPEFFVKSNFMEDLIPIYSSYISQERWKEIVEIFPFGAHEFSTITRLQEGYFFYYMGKKLFLSKNSLNEAVSLFRKAYEAGIGDAAFQIGSIFEIQGNLKEGAFWFSKALKLIPTHLDAINHLLQIPDHLRRIELSKEELINRKNLLTPTNITQIDLGGKIEFLGYQIDSKEKKTHFRLWYRCLDKMATNYILSLHGHVKDKTILEPDRVKYGFGNWDHNPNKITSKWDIGEVYVHDYERKIQVGDYNLTFTLDVGGKYLGSEVRIGWVKLGS